MTQEFATRKTAFKTAQTNRLAKEQAYRQHFEEAAENGDLIQVVGLAVNLTDSRLGRQLAYQLSRAAGDQLFRYLKKEPEQMPEMGIGEIADLSNKIRYDLLDNTLGFLGKPLRELKPQRHPVLAGGPEAALHILAQEAILRMDQHPVRGYTGLDGYIARAINALIGSDLPAEGEPEKAFFEWDSMPEFGLGVEDTRDLPEKEDEFSWT